MKTAAVICELNPFHNGHQLIFDKAREGGADYVVALMSGGFVQRGAPAAFDRKIRAEMALQGGADLVLAYPTRFATSSAEGFASHAVAILDGLRCVDELIFGSETGELASLEACAKVLAAEPEDYLNALREGLKRGLSFPAAREAALPQYAALLKSPNDILALEYLKALKRTGSAMRPAAVKRRGSGYHSGEGGDYPSATALRRQLAAAENAAVSAVLPADFARGVPESVLPCLEAEFRWYGMAKEDDLSLLLIERLLRARRAEELAIWQDVTEDLAGTIFRERRHFRSFLQMTDLCYSKSMTRSHVSRALLHIALDIQKDPALDRARFAHVLGFRKGAERLLGRMSCESAIPVVINPPKDREALRGAERRLFDEELRLSNLCRAMRGMRAGEECGDVLQDPVIVLP